MRPRLPRTRPRRPRSKAGTRAAAWRVRWWRRAGAGVAAAAACWLVLGPYGARSAADLREVVVVAADLPVGHVLAAGDVTTRRLPTTGVPAHAVTDRGAALGRPLAAPVSEGETLTTLRLRQGGATGLPAGARAVHVPLSDAAAAARLSAGDHVDVMAVADGTVVAAKAVVVDVDRAGDGPFGGTEAGRGVTLAVPVERVGALTMAALGGSGHGGVHLALCASA